MQNRTGIPTTVQGVTFRSRLEAKWATMFSLLGIPWEYEPFDADGYIPDFLLLGDDPVLVEVKPAATLTECEAYVARLSRALHGHWAHDILIVGASPTLPKPPNYCGWEGDFIVGLLAEYFDPSVWAGELSPPPEWVWAPAAWNCCGLCGGTSFIHTEQSYRSRLCGHYDGDHYVGQVHGLRALWNKASDKTRWTA